MAVATITSHEFGLKATGGVDATTISTSHLVLNLLTVTSGSAAAGSVALTDAAGNALGTFNSPTASRSTVYDLTGIKINGLIGTLSATDVVAVVSVL